MTDLNVPTQEFAGDCAVCGNPLVSHDVACPRCKTPAAAVSASQAPLPEPTAKEEFSDRFDGTRPPVDSPYPSMSEPDISASTAPNRTRRNIKLAGAALIVLCALAAGASRIYYGSSYGKEANPGAAPLAQNELPEAAQPGGIDAPASAKKTSIDVMGTIDAARSAMVRGELDAAREQLAMLPPDENQRSDVQRITDELIQREHARDSALGLARACEKAGDVPCVLRSAGDALASDISNSEARAMLLHAVTQTGASEVTGIRVDQRIDPTIARHRQVSEKSNVRHTQKFFANNNDIYSKH
jgi:hypothetical protein